MGTVYLTSGHHGLICHVPEADLGRRIVLSPEWLERPVMTTSVAWGSYDNKRQHARAALLALLSLRGIDAAVSYEVAMGMCPQLRQPKRVWAELTIGGPTNVVLKFTHDTRQENAPFRELYQWLEDHYNPHGTPEQDVRFQDDWSDPERWKIFFKLRLKQASNQLREKAKRMQMEAGALQRQANKISSLLK